jgi:hypothetical protein
MGRASLSAIQFLGSNFDGLWSFWSTSSEGHPASTHLNASSIQHPLSPRTSLAHCALLSNARNDRIVGQGYGSDRDRRILLHWMSGTPMSLASRWRSKGGELKAV